MSSNPITSWQVDGETMETVRLYFLGLLNYDSAGVQPRWIQGDSKVGTELASLEITYLIIDREGLEN